MACLFPADWSHWYEHLASPETLQWATNVSGTFAMIATAEIGDKSQLVCMTLAARYRSVPIVLGAAFAFALLNLAGVIFGAAVAQWIPRLWVEIAVVALFTGFGIRALLTEEENEDVSDQSANSHSIFFTTFLMIFAAEFGDKTQLAVAALGAAIPPVPVWTGATLALIVTSALGVWAGRALLQRIPLHWLHRISGLMFLAFAGYTAWPLIPHDKLLQLIERLS
jgi:putative Ca2+/H+ antiporter (TMEM165/GDT1 family)